MGSTRLEWTREGLLAALDTIPEFSAAVAQGVALGRPEADLAAIEHLVELKGAVEGYIGLLQHLIAAERARQGEVN